MIQVQVFGRKKTTTAVAVAQCMRGKDIIKVNERPLEVMKPAPLRTKLEELVLPLSKDRLQVGINLILRFPLQRRSPFEGVAVSALNALSFGALTPCWRC